MNKSPLYGEPRGRDTRPFLMGCVVDDNSPDGELLVMFCAKNWSLRRLKVKARQAAQRLGGDRFVAVVTPSATYLKHCNFPWNQASIFQVVP